MSESTAIPEAGTVAVIHPGDRVLLLVEQGMTLEAAELVQTRLAARFPDVEFTLVEGASGVLVHRELPKSVIPE